MKRIIWLSIFYSLFIIVGSASAQQSDVSSIVPSSAPAFTILGASPTEISKPNTWSALQSSLVQNFSSNNQAVIPKNFSIEFSPYWLSSHPNFTYKNYLDDHNFSLRNLKISIATSKVQYGKDSVQGMGFGFRIPIKTFSQKSDKIKADLEDFITKRKSETTDFQSPFMFWVITFKGAKVGDFLDAIDQNLKTPPPGDATWTTHADKVRNLLKDTIKDSFESKRSDLFSDDKNAIISTIQAYFNAHNHQIGADITKEISSSLKNSSNLEISGALGMVFPTGQFDYSKLSKFGIWSDYTFNLSANGKFDGTIALRYVHDFRIDTVGAVNNFDLLGRINLYTDTKQKFSLSAWGLIRLKTSSNKSVVVDNVRYFNSSNTWDNKYGVDITYKASDNIAFAYSFGKDYGYDPFSLTTLKNKLISFLSIYYSINSKVAKSGSDYLIKSL